MFTLRDTEGNTVSHIADLVLRSLDPEWTDEDIAISTRPISVRLPDYLIATIDILAHQVGKTRSALITESLDEMAKEGMAVLQEHLPPEEWGQIEFELSAEFER